MFDFLEVLEPGCGASFQDGGRPGWKRFGVPPGGWMDAVAAREANRLAGNAEDAVVVELVLQGACFRARRAGWLAVAGASMGWSPETACRVEAGEVLRFDRHRAGVYAYVAAPGGWVAPQVLGSCAVSVRSGLGRPLAAGDVLSCCEDPARPGWSSVARRRIRREICPESVDVQVWRGPQWMEFPPDVRAKFFATNWKVSARSNRMGVRLDGVALEVPASSMLSEPVLPGSVQVTGAGQPVITMRDGPTVGGYPKIASLDKEACRRVAQVPPGGTVKFRAVNE